MTISSQLAPGDLVSIDFPFADGVDRKNRPVLVLSPPNVFGDVVVAMISNSAQDDGVAILPADLVQSSSFVSGYVRVRRIFTVANDALVTKRGALRATAMAKVLAKLCPALGCRS
ncbi:MAG: type II toxin-antitoxin system PemK/MazF family toxin [Betaproteobacteria bacterium]